MNNLEESSSKKPWAVWVDTGDYVSMSDLEYLNHLINLHHLVIKKDLLNFFDTNKEGIHTQMISVVWDLEEIKIHSPNFYNQHKKLIKSLKTDLRNLVHRK